MKMKWLVISGGIYEEVEKVVGGGVMRGRRNLPVFFSFHGVTCI
jgi:hypothetical protein